MNTVTELEPANQADVADLHAILRLCDPELDPLFWPSSRPFVFSAWYGHVPFAHWLVTSTRPATIVELGTHGGASYAAFCEAVLRSGLETRCFAVDTWEGDAHAGRYGQDVFTDLKQFHDGRYGNFSTMIRASFDDAAKQFSPASIDLLHIDGLHTYAAVKNDFETWLPKMSDKGVILFHDIEVHRDGFEVDRLWDELRKNYPSFSFAHCYGLGVLAVGAQVAPSVAALCQLNDIDAQKVRERFRRIGETHELRAYLYMNAVRAQQNGRS